MPLSIPDGWVAPDQDRSILTGPPIVENGQAWAFGTLIDRILGNCGSARLVRSEQGPHFEGYSNYDVIIDLAENAPAPCRCLAELLRTAFATDGLKIDFGYTTPPDEHGVRKRIVGGMHRPEDRHIRLDPRDQFEIPGKSAEWVATNPSLTLAHELIHRAILAGGIPAICQEVCETDWPAGEDLPQSVQEENVVRALENALRRLHKLPPRGYQRAEPGVTRRREWQPKGRGVFHGSEGPSWDPSSE